MVEYWETAAQDLDWDTPWTTALDWSDAPPRPLVRRRHPQRRRQLPRPPRRRRPRRRHRLPLDRRRPQRHPRHHLP
ncbi:acetyl-coenzyme A synthetase N-terminal domain-containing protein [uncultured Lawsonella sp.]|uniref:acetyl-coenzyme A synthetase N-terminal domain-containing protein n=1 Tax=uncultured Lawsonella sp. TaxID=1847727 RepID=UPI003458A35F